MSSLKQRYEQFGDFMQQNVKGVEVIFVQAIATD